MTTTLQQLKEKALKDPEFKALYEAEQLDISDVEIVEILTEEELSNNLDKK
ncbi:hypothetical protein [Shewanella pneumatophori]|uniref:Nif11 domain-containing protein n=1 Tax=Shewanella pneumatophori TaxID=314092 RepID=A0A9X1ZGH0_9GAMM|nr:hypothetical protein [Shewanella pneumatophori]MCL1137308.1 hypothetical protein [Shewanella pneumatophori]